MDNRPIKFRAWVVPDGKTPFATGEAYMATQGEADIETLQSFMHHYGDEQRLMQFTGHYDKHRNEIYEGDLIKIGTLKGLCVVVWDNEFAGFRMKHTDSNSGLMFGAYDYPLKIVGNIHEHKNLLQNG